MNQLQMINLSKKKRNLINEIINLRRGEIESQTDFIEFKNILLPIYQRYSLKELTKCKKVVLNLKNIRNEKF